MTWKPHTEREMLCTKLGLRLGAPGSWVDDKRLKELFEHFYKEGWQDCVDSASDSYTETYENEGAFEQTWKEWLDEEEMS